MTVPSGGLFPAGCESFTPAGESHFLSPQQKGNTDMRLTKESLAPLYTNKHVSIASIARTFGMGEGPICTQARIWGLSRPAENDDEDDSPTADEIKERAAEIRRGWTPEQRASRYVGVRRQRYQIPCYETAELTGAADLPCYARL